MGQKLIKEKLFSAIEAGKQQEVVTIIKKYPAYLNEPMTTDCQSTPLCRAAWRGDITMVKLLICLGAQVDAAGPRGITPLMWAVRRDQLEVIEYLYENKADLTIVSPEGYNSLDYAILHGNYETALFILSKKPNLLDTIRHGVDYMKFAKLKQYRFVNYDLFIAHLKLRVPADQVPSFFKRPEAPKLVDPVIDPRETWKNFFSRILEFEEPPMVERSQLPEHLQPQNRIMGKLRAYINGQSPFPPQHYDSIKKLEESSDKIKQQNQNKSEDKQNDKQDFNNNRDDDDLQIDLNKENYDNMQQKQSSGKKLKKLKDENECAFDKKKSVELQEIQL